MMAHSMLPKQDHRVADHGDGTWEVREYHPNTGTPLNAEYFPTEQEARWYAEARNDGALDIGAMMRVHKKRLAQKRAEYVSTCPCVETGRPRLYCWIGSPDCRYELPNRYKEQ